MSTALLVIDVQQALCFGEYAAWQAETVIGRINLVAANVRAAGRPVILVQHESSGEPLQHGTPGWQLAHGLETAPSDIRLRKRATDSFHDTELQSVLAAHGVTQLIICGLQSEFCVDTTTRRALALGYPVQLVSDAHSTMDSTVLKAPQIIAHHNTTLAHITSFGPRARAVPAADVAVAA